MIHLFFIFILQPFRDMKKVHLSIQRQGRSLPSIVRSNSCGSIGMKSFIISVSSLVLIFSNVVCSSSQRNFSPSHPETTAGISGSNRNLNKVPASPIWPDGLYTQSSYYYADYKIPQPPPPKPKFVPDPPSCPETGRTVCQDVEKYPS